MCVCHTISMKGTEKLTLLTYLLTYLLFVSPEFRANERNVSDKIAILSDHIHFCKARVPLATSRVNGPG